MKRYLIVMIAIAAICASCKKEEEYQTQPLANVTVVNAVVGGAAVRVSTNSNDSLLLNATKAFGFVAEGNVKLSAYPSGSPQSPYYISDLAVSNGDIYNLFVFGQFPNGEGILLKETLPSFKGEECAIRIANLSPNGSDLRVTLSSTPTVNEFSALSYKQITAFKTYAIPFTSLPVNFTFQVRATSGTTVLASLALTAAQINALRYDSATLVIRGLVGGTGTSALGITFVPHY